MKDKKPKRYLLRLSPIQRSGLRFALGMYLDSTPEKPNNIQARGIKIVQKIYKNLWKRRVK